MTFFEFLQKFPTELACIKHYIKIRYNDNIECHHCKSKKVHHREDFPKMFQCASCGNSFSIFKGTIFDEADNTDLF
jgi:ribosomal protein L37AE/L43A